MFSDSNCARCGKRFARRSPTHRFCTDECKFAARGYAGPMPAVLRPAVVARLGIRTCDLCGREFAPRNARNRFCCPLHAEIARADLDRALYDHDHRKLRASLASRVAQGGVICTWPGCGQPIRPGEPWDLGHADGQPGVYAGPQHARCNRSTSRPQPSANPYPHSRDW